MRTVTASVRRALVVPLVLVALAGCSSSRPWEGTALDEPAWQACQAFASEISGTDPYALGVSERSEVVSAVRDAAQGSAWPMAADSVAVLERGADGNAQVWALASDTFAGRCFAAGWPDGVPGR